MAKKIDTLLVWERWQALLEHPTDNSHQAALKPAELAAVLADGMPDGFEDFAALAARQPAPTHILLFKEELETLLDYQADARQLDRKGRDAEAERLEAEAAEKESVTASAAKQEDTSHAEKLDAGPIGGVPVDDSVSDAADVS